MADNNQALRPNLYQQFNNLNSLKEKEEVVDIEQEDTHLYNISGTRGWHLLKEYIQDIMRDLDGMIVTAMQQGSSLEDIGQRTMLTMLAKEALLKVIAKVEDAKEVIEAKNRGSQRTTGESGEDDESSIE